MSTDLIRPIKVFDNVSLATSQVSAGVHIMYTDNPSIQFVWTGTPAGTFGVDVSNNAVLDPMGAVSGGDWTPLVLVAPQLPVALGSAGNGAINLTQLGFEFMRVTYAATSGTGNCTAKLTAKPV